MATCSCGNPHCQLVDLWREATEANDNLSLLYGEHKHLQEHCLPVLDRLAHSRNTLYQEWERGQERYRVQMLDALSRANGQIERLSDIAHKRREDISWIERERKKLEQRTQVIEQAIEAHIVHLSDLQLSITQCSDNPACREALCDVLSQRCLYLERRKERMHRLLLGQTQAAEAKRREYVGENERIRRAQLATNQAHVLGLKGVETRWAMHALFNVGEKRSYQRSEAALTQVSLRQHFLLQLDDYQNKLWYGREHWLSESSWPRQETLEILSHQQRKWHYLHSMFLDAKATKSWNTTTTTTLRLLA